MTNTQKIWQYVKPYKWNALANIVLNVIQIIFSLASLAFIIPFLGILLGTQDLVTIKPDLEFTTSGLLASFNYYISQIIIENGKSAALIYVSCLVVTLFFLKNFFLFFANFYMAPLRNGIVKDIRNNIYKKIMQLPLAYYSEERKGDIISRISNDVKEIEWSIMKSLEAAFRDPFTIFAYMATLIFMSPELTLFILILLPISGLIIGLIGKSLRKESKAAQTYLGELLANVEETLTGLRVIKAFNAEDKTKARFFKLNKVFTRAMNRMARKQYLASPLSEFLGVIVLVIIMNYGGSRILSGESAMKPEVFIGFIAIFSQILNPVKSFSAAWYEVRKGLASIDRINEILSAPDVIPEKEKPVVVKEFNSTIEYRNVSFKYRDEYVLKNINLKIEKGQTVALVGQSGSGKSTMVDLLPRFYDIEEGEILIDGVNVKEMSLKSLRNIMGNVNQEAILFNDTVFNNIAFGVDNIELKNVEYAAKVANAEEFIISNPEGYDYNIGDRGGKLSGGQRQRLSIARAVLKNPPILILDEATSALDTESERLVQDALTKLMENRTSIVIAHRLSTVKHADLICVMQDGQIIERGKHDELLQLNGTYKKLHDLQMF
jgi:subfamily B ATP-binding cassette protein MsbA